MSRARLFVIAPKWNLPKFLSTEEWIHSNTFIPSRNENELLLDTATQMSKGGARRIQTLGNH